MSLDAAIEDLERARPGWGWSVCNYGRGSSTCFLHYPDGQGCTHAEAATPAEAVHAAIALTDDNAQEAYREAKRMKREMEERTELERLKAKYEPTVSPQAPVAPDSEATGNG